MPLAKQTMLNYGKNTKNVLWSFTSCIASRIAAVAQFEAAESEKRLVTDGGLSIDPETLEERRRQQSTTPIEDRNFCPECHSSQVSPKPRADHRAKPGDWRCEHGHHFEEPLDYYDLPSTHGGQS